MIALLVIICVRVEALYYVRFAMKCEYLLTVLVWTQNYFM